MDKCALPDNFDIGAFVKAIVNQDSEKLCGFFEPDAEIFWPHTNELFTVDEYIRVNSSCPGKWKWSGAFDTLDIIQSYDKRAAFTATICNADGVCVCLVSFIDFGDTEDELIQGLTEYWSEVKEPPEWRKEMRVGKRYSYDGANWSQTMIKNGLGIGDD